MLLLPTLLSLASPVCSATDGDTIRCRSGQTRQTEAIRLLAIDAPEMPGHCRRGRKCVPGNPHASRASLAQGLRRGPLTIVRVGRDRYGRTLATVRSGSTDLSCWQLSRRHAIYRATWDNGGRIASTCPSAVR